MNQTLTNLLLAVVAAGTGCAASSTNAVSDSTNILLSGLVLCSEFKDRYTLSVGYSESVDQASDDLFRRFGASTLYKTTVCGNSFSLGYSGSDDSGLCPVRVSTDLPELEKKAIEYYLKGEISSRTGESFQDGLVDVHQRTDLPVNHPLFGMYTITADSGSIYAAHRPVLVYGFSDDLNVTCVRAVRFVGELEFYGCADTISKDECDRRYQEFKDNAAKAAKDKVVK